MAKKAPAAASRLMRATPKLTSFHVRAPEEMPPEESEPESGVVKIAGYANKFEVDSYGERMDPGSIRLERFNENGILLFNHDVDRPVGRVTKVESREDGVWAECELSMSDAPTVRYVRDLVKEGVLKTFSVRFGPDCKYEDDPKNPGKRLVKDWELQELSIVSIPAQANSTFSLAKGRTVFARCKSLDDARSRILRCKGALVAEHVNDAISAAAEESGIERTEIVERLRDTSGLEAGELSEILSGDKVEVPGQFLAACVEVLKCDKSELDALAAQDVENDQAEAVKPASGEKSEAPPVAAPAPAAAPAKPGDAPAPEAEKAPELDQAMQACVAAKLPALLEQGMEQDAAVTAAIAQCSEEKGCTWAPSSEAFAGFLSVMDGHAKQATQEPGPTTPIVSEPVNENAMLAKLDAMVSLLGNLVEEMKGCRSAMELAHAPKEQTPEEPKVPAEEPKGTESETKPTEEEEEAQTAKHIEDAYARLDLRLKSLGV